MRNKKQNDPDQIINQGICVLCIMLGLIIAIVLRLAGLFTLAGGAMGFVVGLILSKIRPRYGVDKGVWKHINHFMLTQMDLSSAFSRNKKESQPVN